MSSIKYTELPYNSLRSILDNLEYTIKIDRVIQNLEGGTKDEAESVASRLLALEAKKEALVRHLNEVEAWFNELGDPEIKENPALQNTLYILWPAFRDLEDDDMRRKLTKSLGRLLTLKNERYKQLEKDFKKLKIDFEDRNNLIENYKDQNANLSYKYNQKSADEHALKMQKPLAEAEKKYDTYEEIAKYFNSKGYTTRRKKPYHAVAVGRLIKRLEELKGQKSLNVDNESRPSNSNI